MREREGGRFIFVFLIALCSFHQPFYVFCPNFPLSAYHVLTCIFAYVSMCVCVYVCNFIFTQIA